MFFVILLYALFASVFTISKTALEAGEPFFLIGSRMFIAGVIILSYSFLVKKESFVFSKKTWLTVGLLGILNIYLTNAFEFWGLRYLTSFKTCFIYSLSPFASALISFVVFSEKMSLRKWAGLLIGFSGFIPIFMHQTGAEVSAGQFWAFSWAELSVALAALTSVWGWIVLKQLVVNHSMPFLMANGLSMLIGGTLGLFHSFFTESWNPVPVSDYAVFAACALGLIVVSNFICYNLYGYLLKKFSATFLSFAGFTTPLFTALFGWFFLEESIPLSFFLSAAIVFSGLALFHHEELVLKAELPV